MIQEILEADKSVSSDTFNEMQKINKDDHYQCYHFLFETKHKGLPPKIPALFSRVF